MQKRQPVVYRKCDFGHLIRVYPGDELIDVKLCPICLRRSIKVRMILGKSVPQELIELAAFAERTR